MNETSNRHTLIAAVAKGDEAALRQLYGETSRGVYRYLCRFTADEQLAEELTVETYVEVWRSAGNCREESQALTWIIGIARLLALNRRRRASREPIDWDVDAGDVDCPLFPPQIAHLEARQTAEVIRSALDRLDPLHREALDLFFLQELGYREIATVLKIPLNTAKTRIFNAKAKMAALLDRMGFSKDDLL